jgi:PAS domain-containing protein
VAHHLPIRLQRSPGAAAEERFLDFIYEPVRDEAGRATGIFCEGRDVTEAHLAQAAVDASNARYTSVLAAMRDLLQTRFLLVHCHQVAKAQDCKINHLR